MEIQTILSRREALRARRRRPSKITIPSGVSPHVRLVFEEMRRQAVTYDRVEEMSGVLRTTLKAWRHKNRPGLESIEAVLGFLGWDLVPVPRSRVLPPALVRDLEALAAKHKMPIEKTIEALVELVARIHERFDRPAASQRDGAPSTAPALTDLVG